MKSWKLLTVAVSLLCATAALAERVPPGTDDDIRARLQPFGDVCRPGDPCASGTAASADAGGSLTGQQVYDQFCGTCHTAGVAGAPVLGDAAAWEPRLDKGMDTLWDHTLNGFNAMPPRGTCMTCSEEELRAAMELLIGQAE